MKKKNILPVVLSIVFCVISVVLSVYYKSSMSEFDSVLDKYLNYEYIGLLQGVCVVNAVFSVCFLVLFVVSLAKRKSDGTKGLKISLVILIVLFVISNSASMVGTVNFQINENSVVDSIPESIGSYVDFNKIFELSPYDDYFHEQTVYNKISAEIPVNYSVQQTSSTETVTTSCVKINDSSLLSEYYGEKKSNYAQNKPVELSADELTSMSADKGFYYLVDNYDLGIIVIKDNKLYDVYISAKDISLADNIISQIAQL